MIAPATAKATETVALKLGCLIANLASIAGFLFYLVDRTSASYSPSGLSGLNVVLHLSLLTCLGYGILWASAERIFHWDYGAGAGEALPTGWSAVALSLSVTLPLVFVPWFYQLLTKTRVLSPLHWRAVIIILVTGAAAHLVMYGTHSNGVRQLMAPTGEYDSFRRALVLEAIYSCIYFGFIVLPYVLTVRPNSHLLELVMGRTILPAMTFFFGMALFIAVKNPVALHEKIWIHARGMFSGVLMMFCFCGAMFL